MLATLSSYATDEGLPLMLDEVDDGGPALTLYERLGWRLVDRRTADWATPEGRHLPLRSYLAPGAAGSGH